MKTQTKRHRHILSFLPTQLVISQVEWTDDEELLVSLVAKPTAWGAGAGSTIRGMIDGFSDDDLFAFTKRVKGAMVVDAYNRRWSWRVLASRGGFFTRDDSGHTVSAFMAFKAVVRDGRNNAQIWSNPFGIGLTLGEGVEIIIGRLPRVVSVSSPEREEC